MATKSSKRSSGKSSSLKSVEQPTQSLSVNIRQIENGFVINKSGYIGKGKNQTYVSKEVFSKTNPIKFPGEPASGSGIKFGGRKK